MRSVCYNINDPEALRGEIDRLRAEHEDMRSRWEVERRALQKQIPSPRLPRASERIDEHRIKQMRAEVEKAYRRLHGVQAQCHALIRKWHSDYDECSVGRQLARELRDALARGLGDAK